MDWIVLLPPVLAIGLALWTKEVYLSLLAGLWLGTTILVGGNPLMGMRELIDQLVAVFEDPSNTRILLFSLLVGGLIALVQASGGVNGFIEWASSRGWGQTKRGAELLAWMIGMVIFVESSITCLIVGAVNRPLFDRLKIPREKLAFYCDSTSAPVCMSIPLNGWGAFVLGLLAAQGVTDGAVGLLASSLVLNFYAIFAIVFSLVLALTGWSFGGMKRAEIRALETGALIRDGAVPLVAAEIVELEPVPTSGSKARHLIVPILVMVGTIFFGLYVTGEGVIMQGSGSTSVLWAVIAAVGIAMVMYALPGSGKDGAALMNPRDSMALVLKGSGGLIGMVVLVALAFALGQVSRALEMGPYIISVVGTEWPTWWLPALIFIVGSFISFTLGSSWTGFAILIPIALPLAEGLGLSMPLMLGAVLAGGVFGDHASPLSDTSLIASMSAASDHVDHINTQLPYALSLAGCTVVAFLIAGLVM
ncbi:MAG: sodium:proton antiporter [Bacteroidetes Order II. Incertae sedis bacterium]|jgi:tetracycline resistance efflux pump|nr:sodium:proton antiporter [Bacteroidetes Order II. bacterium]MBT4051658.1 sodium:proton antiporter [Bacteroidetes Order II. bacterium]MBT4601607.1 sodium:proton antiporter [Bacteroidetes Order II. bacterium]MBT5248938.1 sodium:proton antiporter [Bacteroidetes Order II. bacterium]MBT6200909.1 sodium:proton antiporter [Bacteroidetes Order II. bacterium]